MDSVCLPLQGILLDDTPFKICQQETVCVPVYSGEGFVERFTRMPSAILMNICLSRARFMLL